MSTPLITNKTGFINEATDFFHTIFAPALENGFGDIEIRVFPKGRPAQSLFYNSESDAAEKAYDLCNQGIDVYFGTKGVRRNTLLPLPDPFMTPLPLYFFTLLQERNSRIARPLEYPLRKNQKLSAGHPSSLLLGIKQYVDAVIRPADTRRWFIHALQLLREKKTEEVIVRKQGNIRLYIFQPLF